MWPSTIPPTFPKEVEERLGFPLAFNDASGYVAQRLAARTRRRRAAPSFPAVVRPFAGWAAFLNVKVPFRGPDTTQTAAELAFSTGPTVPFAPAARYRRAPRERRDPPRGGGLEGHTGGAGAGLPP